MKFQVNVSFDFEMETGTYAEAAQRALERIRAGADPEYVSVYAIKEKSE